MSHFCHVLTINHLSLTIAGKAQPFIINHCGQSPLNYHLILATYLRRIFLKWIPTNCQDKEWEAYMSKLLWPSIIGYWVIYPCFYPAWSIASLKRHHGRECRHSSFLKSPPQLWNYSTTRTPYSTGFPQHQAHLMAILDLARNLEVDYQQGLIDISLTNTDLCYYE